MGLYGCTALGFSYFFHYILTNWSSRKIPKPGAGARHFICQFLDKGSEKSALHL